MAERCRGHHGRLRWSQGGEPRSPAPDTSRCDDGPGGSGCRTTFAWEFVRAPFVTAGLRRSVAVSTRRGSCLGEEAHCSLRVPPRSSLQSCRAVRSVAWLSSLRSSRGQRAVSARSARGQRTVSARSARGQCAVSARPECAVSARPECAAVASGFDHCRVAFRATRSFSCGRKGVGVSSARFFCPSLHLPFPAGLGWTFHWARLSAQRGAARRFAAR